ncbi:ribonuclease HII [Halobacillus fulvus]|nr:ribonuclease HII [Halobacillus fulvus]
MASISEIKQKFVQESLTTEEIETLKTDKRKGVQKLIHQYEAAQQKKEDLKNQYEDMKSFEYEAFRQGKSVIAGIDEAGRGPLAGPVVAGAVILPEDFYLEGLNDSKKLSLEKREQFYSIIQEGADWGAGIVSSEEIDQHNIYQATKLAMKRAVAALNQKPDHLLIDAMELDMETSQQSIVKGDQRSVSIAAASIIAKVTRDRYMAELHEAYPAYQFKSNQGYGTKEHLQALEEFGATAHHRRSFSPVREVLNK